MADLALTYLDQGRWEEAEKLEGQVMDTYMPITAAYQKLRNAREVE
jgi:hypothetical protein